MVVVIGAQEDPGDLVRSLDAYTTCSKASNGALPFKICTVTSVSAKCSWMPATTLSII